MSLDFTFQSGSIQIQNQNPNGNCPYTFTFQSGSIQIGVTENASKEANRFTFQSGSIQMIQEPKDSKRLWSLYIPIWFYSNVKG